MLVVFLGLASPIFGALCHAVIVRWLPERLQLALIPVAAAFGFIAVSLSMALAGVMLPFEDYALALVTSLSFSFAYTILFSAVIYDSPTLALSNAILAYGDAGMPLDDIKAFCLRHPFVGRRLGSLVEMGVITIDDDAYVFRGKVGLVLQMSALYRRMCGLPGVVG